MRNLWIFISKYNAFFLFIIFFIVGVVLVLKNNAYQRSVALNSSTEVVGNAYQKLSAVKTYLNLRQVNDSLAQENAKLKTELLALNAKDSTGKIAVKDSVYREQYTLFAAKVIKNSIGLRNNTITIKKGSLDGVVKDMAVISPNKGVIGFVELVSEHFAIIRTLLNKNTLISVNVKKNNAFGSLVWGDGNFDYRKAYVKEIPNHLRINIGDTIITSGAGGFPKGIEVGKVSKTGITGDSFLSLEVKLFNDFSTLPYVYLVKDRLAQEQNKLETNLPNGQ
jgi:rod shape-determining protein MreC